VKKFLKEIIYKSTSKWFMRNLRRINAMYASIQLSNRQTLEDTLNVFMKNSNSTNVVFVTRALAKKNILIGMYNLCMKTRNLSNVICAVFLLSNLPT
jgi:hypothetical protein